MIALNYFELFLILFVIQNKKIPFVVINFLSIKNKNNKWI